MQSEKSVQDLDISSVSISEKAKDQIERNDLNEADGQSLVDLGNSSKLKVS